MNCSPDAVVTMDERGRVLDLNRAAESMFGYSAAEARGRVAESILVAPRLREAHAGALQHLREGAGTQLGPRPSHGVHADGTQFPVEVTLGRTSESPPRVVAWVRDVTDRHTEERRRRALLQSAECLNQIGSWEWIPSEGRLLWSDNLYRIFGLLPGERTPTPDVALQRTHPDDRAALARAFEHLRRGRMDPFSFRVVLDGGVARYLHVTLAVAERRDGRPYRMVGSLQDLTQRRRTEQAIALHVGACEALAEWRSIERDAERLLANLGRALELVAGVLWVPEGRELVARATWQDDEVAARPYLAAARRARLRRGAGLPGRAWERGEPLDATKRSPAQPGCTRAQHELPGGLAIPALHGDEVLAVIELRGTHDAELTPQLLRSLTGISHQLGRFLARRRGDLGRSVLTARELEVLRLAACGQSVIQTAESLSLSPTTIKTHLEKCYMKLRVSSKASAVATALRRGFID